MRSKKSTRKLLARRRAAPARVSMLARMLLLAALAMSLGVAQVFLQMQTNNMRQQHVQLQQERRRLEKELTRAEAETARAIDLTSLYEEMRVKHQLVH